MSAEIYEVVAQGARYWFFFLMALIVWRSYRWLAKDRRQRRKRMRLLPDAGYVGEMVVIKGGELLSRGEALPVPAEGTLGYGRMNDLYVPVSGVKKRHCWLCFDQDEGLLVEPCYGCTVTVDGQERTGRREPLYMGHGSRLLVGEAELRLRLFAGYETVTNARERGWDDGAGGPPPQAAAMTPEQTALWQQQAMWQLQQQAMQQQQYAQWLAAQTEGQVRSEADALESRLGWEDGEAQGENDPDQEDGEARSARGEAWPGDEPSYQRLDAYSPPACGSPQIEFAPGQPIYPPAAIDAAEDDPWGDAAPETESSAWPAAPEAADEDMTDAAAPPKSAYVGPDEAEKAKRLFWDKYLGGGDRR